MQYLTDRKRAAGTGSAKSGTAHAWKMKVTSFALLILVPLFIFTFGSILGSDYAAVTDYYARPFPALIAALTILVSMIHFRDGVQVLIEDYVHGIAQKITILVMICLCFGLAAIGVFAVARLAL